MSKVVFIIGAGCSKCANAPLINNFLDTIHDIYNSGDVEYEFKKDFENVFEIQASLQKSHSKSFININNIEEVFAALEFGKIIKSFPDISKLEIDKYIASFQKVIHVVLDKTIEYPIVEDRIKIGKPHDDFVKLIIDLKGAKKLNCSIITFNYDILVDLALSFYGIKPVYFFEENNNTNYLENLPLLKLHGSVNWAWCNNKNCKNRFNYFDPETILQTSYGRSLAVSEITKKLNLLGVLWDHKCSSCQLKVQSNPIIVPPTWNKSDYHKDLTNVWSRAALELSEAEHIIIIGYSFPASDYFFKYLFALGTIGKSTLRNFIVINKDENVNENFYEMIGQSVKNRYRFSPGIFENSTDWIRSILQVPLNLNGI